VGKAECVVWSCSQRPTAFTTQAEAATINAAKMGGTMASMLDLVRRWTGKHGVSSNGTLTLTKDPPSLLLHVWEEEMAETKATSVESEATATVNVITVTQLTAYISRGHERIKLETHTSIAIEEATYYELMKMKSFMFWVLQYFLCYNFQWKHQT